MTYFPRAHMIIYVYVFQIDIEDEREVKTEDAQTLADFYGIKYVETSALRGINVEESFRIITQEIYDKVICSSQKFIY